MAKLPAVDRIATDLVDPATVIGAALSATYGTAPLAKDGHDYVFLAGVIRNDGAGWQLLEEVSNHRPINITSIETVDDLSGNAGLIRVHYDTIVGAGGMTVMFLAVPDEQLGRYGFTMGTSVTQTYCEIRIGQAFPGLTDYISYDGTNWVSQDSLFTPTFSAGVLTLTHPTIPLRGIYGVSATPRGAGVKWVVDTANSPATQTALKLMALDDSPLISDYVRYSGSAWVTDSGNYTASFDTGTGVLTLTHAAIPSRATARYNIVDRSNACHAVADLAGGFASTTTLKIKFLDYAGNVLLTPTTDMRALVEHGGPSNQLITTPATDMRLMVTHGGGQRQWKPSELNTTLYPGSNIWLFGIMGAS